MAFTNDPDSDRHSIRDRRRQSDEPKTIFLAVAMHYCSAIAA